jgi:hypothetical protein
MNLTQLTQAIQAYAENTESLFVSNIPLFLSQAELRIYNSVQIPVLRKNVTGTVTTSNPYLSCPNDFMAVYSLAAVDTLGSYNYLIDKDVSFIREAYPNPSVTGLPKYYAIFGPQLVDPKELSLILTPTPDANYSVELHYYYMPESITTTASGTTWLSDNYDPVLFYGAMREAMIFMKGEADMVGYYENKYQEALLQLKRLGDGLERGDSYRNNQTKIPYSSL